MKNKSKLIDSSFGKTCQQHNKTKKTDDHKPSQTKYGSGWVQNNLPPTHRVEPKDFENDSNKQEQKKE